MGYTPTTWVDGGPPAIDAANLQHLEQGVVNEETARVAADAAEAAARAAADSTEATARASGDATNAAGIASEASTARAAEATKQARWNMRVVATIGGGSTFTLAAYDQIEVDCTLGAASILPPPSPAVGDEVAIKKTDSVNANLATFTGTVDGTVNPALAFQYGSLLLRWDGAKWIRPDRHTITSLVDWPATTDARYARPRGAWSNVTAYDADNVVTRSGGAYRALVVNTGVDPVGNPGTWEPWGQAGTSVQTVAATVTAAGALVVNAHNPVNATAGAITPMTLPTGQAAGSFINVAKDAADATNNAVTVTGNMRGVPAQSITLTLVKESVEFLADAAGSWWPFADHKPLGSLDAHNDARYDRQHLYDARRSGVTMDGTTDDTPAWTAAAAAALAAGQALLIPPGTTKTTGTVTFTGINVVGSGINVSFWRPTSLGAGVPSIIFTGTGGGLAANSLWLEIGGFSMVGPGPRSLGVKTANCDGLKLQGTMQPSVHDLSISQFDSGLVVNNSGGHVYIRRVIASNNYYGIYYPNDQGDFFLTDSLINGNTYANFATPANIGISGFRFTNVHMGFAPFGIYQEATPALTGPSLFMQDGIFDHVEFEQCDNAAIWCDVPFVLNGNNSSVGTLHMRDCAYITHGTYFLASASSGYAVKFPQVLHPIYIRSGIYPFIAPGVSSSGINAYLVQQLAGNAIIEVIDNSTTPSLFTLLNGQPGGILTGISEFIAGCGGASGTIGQGLISQGAGNWPTWQNIGSGPNLLASNDASFWQ